MLHLIESVYRGVTVTFQLTKVFKKVFEGYIGFAEELPGANTQAGLIRLMKQGLV